MDFAKKIFILVMAMIAMSLAYGQDTIKIRVMCYNMRFGERASIEEFASFINEYAPDFVALQEVDCRNSRENVTLNQGRDFIAELATQTGMFGLYGKAIDFAGGYYGVGILSKYPYIEVKKTMLPNPRANEQRVILEGVFEMPCDTLTFACTHLDYEYPDVIEKQAEFLCQHFSNRTTPAIIAGDFNTTPDSEAIADIMMHNWLNVSGNAPSYPETEPTKKIDYIFADLATGWEVEKTETVATGLSDHRPIVSDIYYTTNP